MSDPRIRTVQVLDSRLEQLAQILRDEPAGDDGIEAEHIDDEQIVAYCAGTIDTRIRRTVERHLSLCAACSAEVAHLRDRATMWSDDAAVAAFEARVRAVTSAARATAAAAIEKIWEEITAPLTVSLKSMMIPQGAYGQSVEEETATVEFFVTQEGKVVDGLRGLLKRVNREYYVRIFAIDPGARTTYGDRKAMISISDTYQDRPILHRKIDIGVTVLLGTDFRLTDNSSLAVEMLPSRN